MALAKDVNSYCTVAEADDHFADRLDVAAWTNAVPQQKEQALITATALLDSLQWEGAVASENQKLMFPRLGSYYDTSKGIHSLMTPVPERILSATFELAYHLLNNDGLFDDTGGVKSLTLGTLTLDTIKSPSKFPAHIKRIIRPLRVQQRFW